MRRSDREISDFHAKIEILSRCEVIRIGFSTDTTPYIVPLHFGFSETNGMLTLYIHGAKEGRKMSLLEKNATVSFEADRLIDTYGKEGGLACIWTADFESVMGEGKLRLVSNLDEKQTALDLLMKRYGFQGKPQYAPEHLKQVAVLALDVLNISGKAKGAL